MLAIKLSRIGRTKQPTYRLIVQENSKDPQDKSVEIIGNYNPRTEPKTINVDVERAKYWLSKGAQPTPTVHNLLVDLGAIDGSKVKATKGDLTRETERKAAEAQPQAEVKTEDKPVEPVVEGGAQA